MTKWSYAVRLCYIMNGLSSGFDQWAAQREHFDRAWNTGWKPQAASQCFCLCCWVKSMEDQHGSNWQEVENGEMQDTRLINQGKTLAPHTEAAGSISCDWKLSKSHLWSNKWSSWCIWENQSFSKRVINGMMQEKCDFSFLSSLVLLRLLFCMCLSVDKKIAEMTNISSSKKKIQEKQNSWSC